MGMTSNEDDIYSLTGLKIGKVYLNDREYASERANQRVLDCESGNFHLFPVLTKDDYKVWHDYFSVESKVQELLYDLLNKNDLLCKKFGSYSISQGKTGILQGIPQQFNKEGLNHFFRYVQIKIEKRTYMILFKRFYIDKDNRVNCRFGDVQFYTSLDANGNVNEFAKTIIEDIPTYTYRNRRLNENRTSLNKLLIHYPSSFRGQNEKMIRLSNTDNCVNVYNPKGIKNVFCDSNLNVEQYAAQIADSFVQYIECIDKKISHPTGENHGNRSKTDRADQKTLQNR